MSEQVIKENRRAIWLKASDGSVRKIDKGPSDIDSLKQRVEALEKAA